jgi:hypothetical protein
LGDNADDISDRTESTYAGLGSVLFRAYVVSNGGWVGCTQSCA